VKLPDAAGKTLYFPTLQTCEQGQTDWAEIPRNGQSEDELKSPAPSLAVAAASGDGHGHAAVQANSADGGSQGDASNDGNDGGAQARSWAGLVAGVAGLGLGGAAFFRTRARKTAN
jgi:hypothetical protein